MTSPDGEVKIVEGVSGAQYETIVVADENLGKTEVIVAPVGDDGIVFSADPG